MRDTMSIIGLYSYDPTIFESVTAISATVADADGAEHTGSGVYSGKGDPRVTKVGKFIRATSIDELPQLINIIVGDRGIIGTTKKNIDFSSVVTA